MNDIFSYVFLITVCVAGMFVLFILIIELFCESQTYCMKFSKKYEKSLFLDYIDDLDMNTNKDNIFPPSMSDRKAMDILWRYLLGEDWYSMNPISHEQINTEIVHLILLKYSKRYRKECKYRKYIKDRKG